MIVHVVLLKPKPEVTDERRQAMTSPNSVRQRRRFQASDGCR